MKVDRYQEKIRNGTVYKWFAERFVINCDISLELWEICKERDDLHKTHGCHVARRRDSDVSCVLVFIVAELAFVHTEWGCDSDVSCVLVFIVAELAFVHTEWRRTRYQIEQLAHKSAVNINVKNRVAHKSAVNINVKNRVRFVWTSSNCRVGLWDVFVAMLCWCIVLWKKRSRNVGQSSRALSLSQRRVSHISMWYKIDLVLDIEKGE